MNSLHRYIMIFSTLTFIFLGQNLAYSQINVDGNPSEWPGVLNNASNTKKAFKHDPFNATGVDDQWTQGSKDTDPSPASNWKWVYGNSNDKGDIGNAGAVLLGTKLYFFGDRAAFNGDAQIGFWFFLNDVMPTGSGASASPFVGEHANGDLLILSNFTNGGGNAKPSVFVWSGKTANNPGGLIQVNPITVSAAISTNTASYNVPGGASGTPMFNGDTWIFSPKSGTANTYPPPLFFEGSVDLATIQGISPCFKRFLLETRNSQSITASLQDLAAGGFSGVPPAPSAIANSRCGAGSVSLSASGCTGTLNWYANASGGSPIGSGTTYNTPSISQTTTYYVSCTTDGCESSRTPVVATINPPPTAGASFTPILCYGGNSTITASASGGTGPYTYSLDDATYQSGNTFVVLAGSYTVYVQDSKGCKGQYPVSISQPPSNQPDINIGPGFGTYCGLTPAQAQALLNSDFNAWLNTLQIISTGTAPYTIVTNPQNPTPPNFSGGSVEVTWTITDACGKVDVTAGTFSIGGCTIECLLQSTPTPCNVPGSITAKASGGFPQYRFELYLTSDATFSTLLDFKLSDSDPGIVSFTGLAAGDYTVLMLDQVQNTKETATACSIIVSRDAAPPVTKHCSNDQFTACGLTQAALNADYASWFASLAPTGGTNLQYSIEVKDAQGNVVDIDGVFAPNKCGAVYTATVTYSDDCSQTGSCQGTYTVVGDTEAPVISTQNQSGYLGCNPTSIVPPSFSANDNCDGALQPSVSDGGVQSEGCGRSQTWTASVSDGCGNAATQKSITYTWKVDTEPPVISTQNQNGDLGCNPQSIVPPSFSATDNCDGTLQPSVSDGGVQSNGCGRSQTWTASVSDGCGNPAVQKSITYTWKVDTTKPIISSQNQNTDLGCNPTSIVAPTFSANDNCDGVLQASVSDGGVQSNGCGRSQTWTATVSDACGNAATPKVITYTWKVDTEPPVISCPGNYSLRDCDPQPVLVLPNATDNCSGQVTVTGVRSDNLALNAPFPIEQTLTITYTALDACGNSASCSFTVYVTPCITGKACTPGFWKNHKEVWDAQNDFTVNNMPGSLPSTPGGTFITTTNFFTYFGISPSSAISNNGNLTMLGAVSLGGGDCKALARHGVSALLGAAAFPDEYPFDAAGVSNFQELYNLIRNRLASGNCGPLADILANINNLDGPFCSALAKLPDARIGDVYTNVESPAFTVYPVPFKDNFTILYEFDYKTDVLIQVFDSRGRLLLNTVDKDAYHGKEMKIDFPLTHQKGELFFIRIETNKGHFIKNISSSTN